MANCTSSCSVCVSVYLKLLHMTVYRLLNFIVWNCSHADLNLSLSCWDGVLLCHRCIHLYTCVLCVLLSIHIYTISWLTLWYWFQGWRGRSGSAGGRSPGCFFWVLPKRSIPKPDQHRKYIIQWESLGTDMLYELKNSNYTRYHVELVNRSCGGWLVSIPYCRR